MDSGYQQARDTFPCKRDDQIEGEKTYDEPFGWSQNKVTVSVLYGGVRLKSASIEV